MIGMSETEIKQRLTNRKPRTSKQEVRGSLATGSLGGQAGQRCLLWISGMEKTWRLRLAIAVGQPLPHARLASTGAVGSMLEPQHVLICACRQVKQP